MKKVLSLVLAAAMLLSTVSLGMLFTGAQAAYIPGDVNEDGSVDTADAIYLLYHVIFGDGNYPLNQNGDFNNDNAVNTDDAIYLLYHVIFGDENYPLEAPMTVPDILVTDGTTIEGWSNAEGAGGGIPMPEIDAALGCVAATYSGNVHSNGGWNRPEGHTGIKIDYCAIRDTNYDAQAFDITDMNYLIFDLYVSDAAMLSGVRFYLELTSGGKSNMEGICWQSATLSDLKGSVLTNGWNHFEIDLSTYNHSTGGSFNSANWNFLRIYNRDAFNAGEGLTIGFKNLGFSATSAAVEANRVATQRIINLYSSLADIDVGDITAANYRTVSAQLSAATQAYDRASTAVKAMVDEALNVAKIKRIVTRALEKYNNGGEPVVPNPPVNPPLDDYLMNIPQQNYGKTFTFFAEEGYRANEVCFESEEDAMGDVVDMAIFDRNNRVAEHLGVNFELITTPNAGWSTREDFIEEIWQDYVVGDQSYQLISIYEAYAAELAIKGLGYDANSIDAIDLSMPWYVQGWHENTIINDRNYMLLSDLSYSMWQHTNAMYFNKQMSDQLGITDDLYTLAESGDLTLDYVMSCAEVVAEDDGNGWWDENDKYGIAFNAFNCRVFPTCFDVPVITQTNSGEYEIVLNSERAEHVFTTMQSYLFDSYYVYLNNKVNSMNHNDYSVTLPMFMDDRLLFLPATLNHSFDLRQMCGEFGILPFPKFDDQQESYRSHSNDTFTVFMIPAQTNDSEFCGTVVDALSAENKYSVISAYRDVVLKGPAIRDERAIAMLDLIRDNLYFDFAFAHLSLSNNMWIHFGGALINENITSFESYYATNAATYEQKLDEIMEAYWRIR